jgi:ATP/maltotriose-dependent transcriptional regulator MalT
MVLFFFLFYFYRQKMQYKKEALEARQQQLEALSKMRHEELARHKHRLLKQSVQSNQLRARILDICGRYRRNTSMLVRKVEMAFREEPVWEDFLLDFNQNYPGFIDNMLRKYPDISKRQLQYIVLIALGFNNQEISEMLFVTLSGVEKAKIRLAQQLRIEDKKKLSRKIRSLFFHFTQRTGEEPL